MSQQPLQWMRAATQTGKHGAEQATCAMCGTELPVSLMMPDGGEACADVRWYCRDTVACTQRWTEAEALRAAADEQASLERPDDGHDEPNHAHDEPDDAHAEPGEPDDAHAEPGEPDAAHAEPQGPDDGHDEPGDAPDEPDDGHAQDEGPDDGHEEHKSLDDEQSEHPVTGVPGAR